MRNTLEARFLAKVDTSGGPDACWPWSASCGTGGYGQIFEDGRPLGAHRVAWELHNGRPVPALLFVLHGCDNRRCCNPTHLFLGTQADNIADMDRKGRGCRAVLRGERAGLAKLTDERVLELRQRYAAGARQVDLAEQFGICQATVSSIVRRVTWSHI